MGVSMMSPVNCSSLHLSSRALILFWAIRDQADSLAAMRRPQLQLAGKSQSLPTADVPAGFPAPTPHTWMLPQRAAVAVIVSNHHGP